MRSRWMLFLLWTLSTLVSCNRGSRREVWIVPIGYRGWLRLDYNVAGAPVLPIENGSYLVRIPRSGRLQTSTANMPQIDHDSYYTEGPTGRRPVPRLILSDEYSVQSAFSVGTIAISRKGLYFWRKPHIESECVFVGIKSDFQADGRNCSEWKRGDPEPPTFSHKRLDERR
jgi:hypothetical protein